MHTTHTIRLRLGWSGVLLHAWHQLSLRWSRAKKEHEERLVLAAVADLDPHTLGDIGAPDWLKARAEAVREARIAEQIRIDSSW